MGVNGYAEDCLSNIFQTEKENGTTEFQKADGAIYLFLYIVVPVAITSASLVASSGDRFSAIYCYVTILVSALNCIYDATNRWVSRKRTTKNGKLFLIMLSAGIIATYCTYIVFMALITSNMPGRCDYILLSYILAAVVALIDFLLVF